MGSAILILLTLLVALQLSSAVVIQNRGPLISAPSNYTKRRHYVQQLAEEVSNYVNLGKSILKQKESVVQSQNDQITYHLTKQNKIITDKDREFEDLLTQIKTCNNEAEQLNNNISSLQITVMFSNNRVETLEKQLKSFEKTIFEKESKVASLESEIQSIIRTCDTNTEKLRNEKNELQQTNYFYKEKIDNLEKQLKQCKNLEVPNFDIDNEIASLRQQNSLLSESLNNKTEQIQSQLIVISALKQEISNKDLEFEVLKNETDSKVKTFQIQAAQLNKNISSLHFTVDSKNKEIKTLQVQNYHNNNEIGFLKQQNALLSESLNNKTEQLNNNINSLQFCVTSKNNLIKSFQQQKTKCENFEKQIEEKNTEIADLEKQSKTEVEIFQNHRAQLNMEISFLQSRIVSKNEEIETLEKHYSVIVNISELLSESLNNKTEQLQSQFNVISALKQEIANKDLEFDVLKNETDSTVKTFQIQAAQLNNNINSLHFTVDSKNKEIEMLQKEQKLCEDNIKKIEYFRSECTNQLNDMQANKNTELQENMNSPKVTYDEQCPKSGKLSDAFVVSIPNVPPFKVPCTTDSENKVWSIIQRRLDQTLSFNRGWNEYRQGFGAIDGEFFLGLDKLYLMTKSQPHELLIRLTTTDSTRYARYSHFQIGNNYESFAIKSLGEYSGDAGDGLRESLNLKFSTFDNDNDQSANRNCAKDGQGGWWLEKCGKSNLNLKHYMNNFMLWNNKLNIFIRIEMMIRPTKAN